VLLAISLSLKPGDSSFYLLTGLLAAVWIVGGFASGPIHLGQLTVYLGKDRVRGELRRPIITPILLGLVISAIFVVGALIVREIPPLREITENVLAHAREGSMPLIVATTLVNGVAEEIFFRGAVFPALPIKGRIAFTTLIYALATAATGNPMLVFAAATLGVLLALQRMATGGVLASSLTHVTWSAIMLVALPPLFPH
jgi:membrane protease YdiL (CAAX protease family)